ncbi:FecR family protein [Chitinophaga agrisoli]|uniref:FecR family protein n=1 Tax=Chitinophaga agrisoli TaxID=2607653 RepID=A0A5B2VIP9_9BACT|nr:FecR domain-containing protein [Chitinophaga agrisoli]KAA2238784.1 FecR family protein [Chitinophaga agrisoli]
MHFFDQDEFLVLLLRQLENCTSWEEELYIERTLRSSAIARQLLEDVKETFLVKENAPLGTHFRHAFKDIDISSRLDESLADLQPTRKKRYLNVAAAVLVAVATAGAALYIPLSMHQQEEAAISAITMPQNGVMLQLAKGGSLPLTGASDMINTQTARIQTNSNMLRFTAKDHGAKEDKLNTLRVPAGNTYSVTLADGTVVHMNAATSLRFPFAFNGQKREVYLDGEAFFTVAHNPDQPFIVHTQKGDINVLGTAFNINTYDSRFKLSLLSGAVTVAQNNSAPVKIAPCQTATLDEFTNSFTVTDLSDHHVVSWLYGLYRFRQQPLRDVCEVAERWYDVQIKFDSEELAKLTYSGAINRTEPLEAFLKSLKDNGKVDSYYMDISGAIHLELKPHHTK